MTFDFPLSVVNVLTAGCSALPLAFSPSILGGCDEVPEPVASMVTFGSGGRGELPDDFSSVLLSTVAPLDGVGDRTSGFCFDGVGVGAGVGAGVGVGVEGGARVGGGMDFPISTLGLGVADRSMLGLGVVDADASCSGLKTLSSSGIGVRGRNLAAVGISSALATVVSTAFDGSAMAGVAFCKIKMKKKYLFVYSS